MKILVAGAWIGEFGWELMTWIPHLRSVSNRYEKIIVICKSGHEYLYEFADDFVNFDCSNEAGNQWLNHTFKEKADKCGAYHAILNGWKINQKTDTDWINPQTVYNYRVKTHKDWLTGLQPQEFIEYGELRNESKEPYIVFNVRNRSSWDSAFRNWDIKEAQRLAERFPDTRVVCIGSREESLTLPNACDLRGQSAGVVANTLRNASVFVSSINGATHFATLCGCPQVAWVTKPDHSHRLKKLWNPFNTPTKVFVSPKGYWKNRIYWTPEIDQLENAVKRYL